jgi:hypothetical protein
MPDRGCLCFAQGSLNSISLISGDREVSNPGLSFLPITVGRTRLTAMDAREIDLC